MRRVYEFVIVVMIINKILFMLINVYHFYIVNCIERK